MRKIIWYLEMLLDPNFSDLEIKLYARMTR
jgi:hypothetical protein